jgi:Phosphatidylinositol-4-phosphate 5-Kinase
LDITQAQGDKILSQLEQDVEVLNKNGFIDYSLFMIVVLRPFKNVEHFKPQTLGAGTFEEVKSGEDNPSIDKAISMMVNYQQQQLINSTKRLYIGEIDSRLFMKGEQHLQMMLVKETTRSRTKIFHICDPYDIATIRALREQEESDKNPLLRKKTDLDKMVDHSVEEEDGRYSLLKEENPLKKMS